MGTHRRRSLPPFARAPFALACLLVACASQAVAQPPPGTTTSPSVGPSARPSSGTVALPPSVPPAYAPLPSASGTSPSPPANPWSSPLVVSPMRVRAPTAAPPFDANAYAAYERLPRRGPLITMILFGTLGIVSGLPTLARELHASPPRDTGALVYGAVLTGVGTLAIAISTYKLVVRRRGIARLRERGYEVSFRIGIGGVL